MFKNIAILVLTIIVIGGIYWSTSNKTSNVVIPMETDQGSITSGENPEPGSIHDLPVEPAAAVARKDLATKLGADEKSIVILQVKDMSWNDSCLGLGGPAESCLQALTPGFEVEMLVEGKTYIYRTDKIGDLARIEFE